MKASPKVSKRVTPLAHEMIETKGLATIFDRAFEEIQALPLTEFQVQKVDVEWEVDPDIEGWEMLSVTLLCHGLPENAWSCWQELDKAMQQLRQRLSKADLDKLDKFISVGVDIE